VLNLFRRLDQLHHTLSHNGDELFIQVGGFRHRQILPRTLAGLNPSGARLDEASHLLTVRFDQVEPVRT
jgi:hypothetical protein